MEFVWARPRPGRQQTRVPLRILCQPYTFVCIFLATGCIYDTLFVFILPTAQKSKEGCCSFVGPNSSGATAKISLAV